MSDLKDISPEHLKTLRDESGISDDVIRARGYRTVTVKAELGRLGFTPAQQRVPGLLIPLHTTDKSNTLYVHRPDNPRVYENRKKKLPDGTHPCTAIKYEYPKGEAIRVDCPPICQPMLADPKVTLWITEGQKKPTAWQARVSAPLTY